MNAKKNRQVIFTGIQPSGRLHLGNYFGAIKPMVELQNEGNEVILMLADMHTITVPQQKGALKDNSLELTAWLVASGIDPEKTHIFVQSQNPDHAYLTWIFDCITPMGWMERMTQFKDKSKREGERTSVGLFHYPSLMATDILLYDPDLVPVGEDQIQHLEYTRNIARRFNKIYGELFKIPKALIKKESARLMSLQEPISKMSKSVTDPMGTIDLLDDSETIIKKITRAVTDSGAEITYSKDKPAVSNLMTIYAEFTGLTFTQIEKKYQGRGYARFKKELADIVVQGLKPIQEKHHELRRDSDLIQQILIKGKEYAIGKSHPRIKTVRQVVGFI